MIHRYLLAVAFSTVLSGPALAQGYPTKPIRVVVSTTAGSQPDTLLAPARTPRAVINQLNKEMVRILALPDVKERTQSIGYVVDPSTPEEYNKIVRSQILTLQKLVRDAGLKPK